MPVAYYADIVAEKAREWIYNDDSETATVPSTASGSRVEQMSFDALRISKRFESNPEFNNVAWVSVLFQSKCKAASDGQLHSSCKNFVVDFSLLSIVYCTSELILKDMIEMRKGTTLLSESFSHVWPIVALMIETVPDRDESQFES